MILCGNVSTPPGEPGRPGLRRLGLCVLLAMLGAFAVAGCYLDRTVDQATAEDVNNRSFAFPNGAVFHAGLVNVAATLSFTNNATTFTLSSSGGMAMGTNMFDSCKLTVTSSTYASGAGPQVGDVITLDPCEFDSETLRLTVENRRIIATSERAMPIDAAAGEHQATVTDVNNQRFTFLNGSVFHSGLTNIPTALGFTNNATAFTLSSTRGTANGTSRLSSCILTVEDSDYPTGTGPQANSTITLNPCIFNGSNRTLRVTNGEITATSEPAEVTVP